MTNHPSRLDVMLAAINAWRPPDPSAPPLPPNPAFRGMLFMLLLSVPVWVMIGLVVWWLW